MSRAQTDGFIDDDEETCPLCITEFDLGDKNFKPCPCGYQICQFCYNTLTTINDRAPCPNCRRVYDEKTIEWKIPSAEEVKADQANKTKKEAAKKRKEAEKREVDASSRKNLAGVRVKQKNLVYVIGICPTTKDESQILQTLRGEQHFGQYGEIDKIVVSKAKIGSPQSQGIGVYVTYATKEAAALCIAQVDGSSNGDKVLRAQYGTTKYCSAFLRHETCNNKNCSFLHETGEENDDTARQDTTSTSSYIPSRPYLSNPTPQAASSQGRPAQPQAQPTATVPTQALQRRGSKDESPTRSGSTDAAALPATANWANKEAQIARTRRSSLAASRSSPSPKMNLSTVASQKSEDQSRESSKEEEQPTQGLPAQSSSVPTTSSQSSPSRKVSPKPAESLHPILDDLIASATSPDFRFVFDDAAFSKEDLEAINRYPSLIDPYGGVKRRIMREKEEAERAKAEVEAPEKVSLPLAPPTEDENLESGSLQLGGEPDEAPSLQAAPVRAGAFREGPAVIQRPTQQGAANGSVLENFSNLGINGRSLTPQQQQQLMLLTSSNGQAAHGPANRFQQPNFGSATFDMPDHNHSGLFANQPSQAGPQGHTRQTSRYSFANDSHAKATANNRFTGQQTPSIPGAQGPHPGGHFYSAVQGPPPGLKTAGTPPISGGGMFAQGHGFGSNMNTGMGHGGKDAEYLRGRSGTGGAGGQGRDLSKREYLSPTFHSPPIPAPAPGLLGSLYGYGPYHDPTLVKQKKKGKKHRHANTSSGGGGVVDLADPTILASMHQGATGAGQGLFGGQSQDDQNFPPLQPPKQPLTTKLPSHATQRSHESAARATTPTVPPGLTLPHAHPSPSKLQDITQVHTVPSQKSSENVTPALPVLPIGASTVGSQKGKANEAPQIDGAVDVLDGEDDVTTSPFRPDAVSLGSPKSKAAVIPRKKPEIDVKTVPPQVHTKVTKEPSDAEPGGSKLSRAMPTKLDIAAAMVQPSTFTDPTSKTTTPILPLAAWSRPSTPATGVSRASESSARPKILRLTTTSTSKGDPSVPLSATSIITQGVDKMRSRRPSLSSAMSQSRPPTPAGEDRSLVSDSETKTSADISRAPSPRPGSIVGSAPTKSKSKSQLKKDRKSKVKDVNEDVTASLKEAVDEQEEIAPIISRQKKKKRTTAGALDDSASEVTSVSIPIKKETKLDEVSSNAPTTNSRKAAEKAEAKVSAQTVKVESSKEVEVRARATNTASRTNQGNNSQERAVARGRKVRKTLAELYQDVDDDGRPDAMLRLLNERITAPDELLGELVAEGHLDAKTFKPPPFSSYGLPRDATHAHEDFGTRNTFDRLTEAHKTRLLKNGEAIRICDPANQDNLLRRLMITPKGAVIRHFSREEEDTYLAREKRLAAADETNGPFSHWDRSPVLEEDPLNQRGGIHALLQTPAKFGIEWVAGHGEDIDDSGSLSDADANAEEVDDSGDDTDDNLGLAVRTALTGPYGSSQVHPVGMGTSTGVFERGGPTLDLSFLDINTLMARIQETARELEQNMKQTKLLDQKSAKQSKGLEKWLDGVMRQAEFVQEVKGEGAA